MTRDEHIAEAEALLKQAAREFLSPDGDPKLALAAAQVHATLAETLGRHGPVEASAWEWAGNSLVHASGDWEIEYIHGCETDALRPRAGWYLYGPPFRGRAPLWVGSSPDEARASADKGIADVVDMPPRTWRWNGTEYDLAKKYRSTRGDFTYEFVGTLTDGMPLMRQYPAGVRALINPAATVFRMVGPLVPVDEDEVPF